MKEFDIKKEIISFFRKSAGSFVSGEEISGALGFSRASVWKYINKLREEGYHIEAVPHLGYRLKSSPDRVYSYDISSGLNTVKIGKQFIDYYDNIGSTNDRAYQLAEGGEPEGTIVIAESQTRGKGRMGRKWTSPKASGIYMSIILRPDVETDEIPALTIIAAVAIIRAIKKACGVDTRMKWPNDILIEDKKVCGILTEIKAQPDAVEFLVLGIGVNVNTPRGKLPPEGTSLKIECGYHVSRPDLVRNMLSELESYYLKFNKEGFSALRDECMEYSLTLGKRVKVVEHHRSIEGVATGMDAKGALMVKTDDGEIKRVFSGDVAVK